MKVLVVVAHPDDETFGPGSLIARAVREGAEVVVCCATRGELGEPKPGTVPEGSTLGAVREGELREAAAFLGVHHVRLLTFADSGWDGEPSPESLLGAPFAQVVQAVQEVIVAERPDVVVTLDPAGGDGHRDHVRISQAATVAFDAAAPEGASLYYWCLVQSVMRKWIAFRAGSVYDTVPDDDFGFPDEHITTVVDAREFVAMRWHAIALHRSQASPYDGLPDDLAAEFLSADRLVRARPAWTGGASETWIWDLPTR